MAGKRGRIKEIENGKMVGAYLDDWSRMQARRMGDGNLSAGLRNIIAEWHLHVVKDVCAQQAAKALDENPFG